MKIFRTRALAPVIHTTRKDVMGRVIAVTFTDGTAADRLCGYWAIPATWSTPMTALPENYRNAISAIAADEPVWAYDALNDYAPGFDD